MKLGLGREMKETMREADEEDFEEVVERIDLSKGCGGRGFEVEL